MPPKRSRLPKEHLKKLVDDYDINFEGPVPPKQWPINYSSLFHVIRNIWANRYDDYIKRTDINQRAIKIQKARVRDLRTKATSLRADFGVNEETWRSLIETTVMGRFDQEILCVRCENENWESEYEAQPFNENERANLEIKRKRRRQCTCHDNNNSSRNPHEDSDEEKHTKIFSAASSGEVSHDPQDDLDNFRIPMKPDRVIGLSMNDRYRRYIGSFPVELSHSPIKKSRFIYPFLVLEAKREHGPPGFRSVEAQTAFPIRRFLRIQDELRTASETEFDPLVWFFAFQGEEWRLYSAILNDKNIVQVFHLWHGNLESQDGALQIFQIVDFIWTWARDVYRPQIRMCLSRHSISQREISPTSTNRCPRSQSVFSVLGTQSFSQLPLETTPEDDTMAQEGVNDDQLSFQDASSHPFLRWASYRDVSAPWTAHTSIRHSDIVIFSFRVLEIPETQEGLYSIMRSLLSSHEPPTVMLHALKIISQNQYTLPLKRDQISSLERYWTGGNMPTAYEPSSMSHPDQIVRAFFFFRTFCQPEDWQLKRELYCVIWSPRAARVPGMFLQTEVEFDFHNSDTLPLTQPSVFNEAFWQLRELSGRHSVAYALNNTSLVLSPCNDASRRGNQLRWRQPHSQGIPELVIAKTVALFDSASYSGDGVRSYHHQCSRLLWVFRAEANDISPGLITIPDSVGRGGAMLAVKPGAWPQQCSRFCLFVLLGHDFDDKARLGGLLRYTIQEQDMYCAFDDTAQESKQMSVADKNILKSWKDSFS